MEYDIRVEQRTPQLLAVVRRQARPEELATLVPQACEVVWDAIRAQHTPGVGRNVAVYLDAQITVEVGVEVDAPFIGYGEVVGSATPSGAVVTTTHYGPYGLLHAAHTAIQQWCGAKGYALAGPQWEVYGHWQDAWNSDPT